jgi:hypothetical protein
MREEGCPPPILEAEAERVVCILHANPTLLDRKAIIPHTLAKELSPEVLRKLIEAFEKAIERFRKE